MSLYLTDTQRERLFALCDECRALGANPAHLEPILSVARARSDPLDMPAYGEPSDAPLISFD